MTTCLEPLDVECVAVHDGHEALAKLRTERFDAMTLDVLMPEINGLDVLRAIRADDELAGLPVVIVSVFSGREALAKEWVVPKPVDAGVLADALGAAVIASRVRVLVVGRPQARDAVAPALARMGIEGEFAPSRADAEHLCRTRRFEVALVDAGIDRADEVIAALRLRGRRLARSVLVFAPDGEDPPGIADLDADRFDPAEAGAAVLALLDSAPARPERERTGRLAD